MLRIAQTENGKVKGLPGTDPRITVFKGIPFAAPPVGKNRWRAPQPCESWEGVRDCFAFGPISVQDTPGLGTDVYCKEWHVDPDIPMGEDCLYLNVWTPAKKTDEKLPVLVWYFGGGFQWGYTAEMEFDGERLASRGIIVVSVNYRLGAFGFLSHPEITAEAPEAPGNFGFLDQQAGLRWVARNIAAFGGDPDRITIAGQSAGGASVMNQLTCEQNFGLIKGALIYSGIIRFTKEEMEHASLLPGAPDIDLFTPATLEKAEKKGSDFFEFLGVKNLEEARALDPYVIRDKYAKYRDTRGMFVGIEDGKFCVGDPVNRFINGDCAKVPVISGNTTDEFIVGGVNTVERSVKNTFREALEKDPDRKLFYYRFGPEMPGDDRPGCFHSVDLWFFFETLMKCWRPLEGYHYDLARKMANYVANFVKTGDPNGADADGSAMPLWKTYNAAEPNEMNFVSEGAVPGVEINRPKQVYNPYMPAWEYVPDGEPHVFGDRVYVYGSHDRFNGETFCLNDYVCWSAPVYDLKDWRYEGVIYRKTQDPLNADGHMCLYAPDVTQGADGRYYLYYVLDKVNVVSVAVSDTPAGKYEYLGNVAYPDGTLLGNREGDEPQFDPGVLFENGQVYLFTGFCGQTDKSRHGAMLTVLESDMLTVKKAPQFVAPGKCYSEGTAFEGHAFFEAPSIRKRNGKYYFVYSSEVMHELCYATSDSPEGPYTYGGVIISNCDKGIAEGKPADLAMAYGANNHGSIEEINGKWYIFYHRHTNANWYSRQACAEEICFAADDSIPQARLSSCGLNGGPLSDAGEYPASICCHLFTDRHDMYVGDQAAPRIIQDRADGFGAESYVAHLCDGATMGYRSFDCKGVTGLRIQMIGYLRGVFEIRTAWDGPVLGTIRTDNANVWTVCETKLSIPDGVQDLYLTFRGDGTGGIRCFEFLHGSL